MPHKHLHADAVPRPAPLAVVVPTADIRPVVAQPMPTTRPRLLTIGAHRLRPDHAVVRHAPTLLAGYDLARRALTESARPTVILLDLDATEPGFPELAAPQLAAVLAQGMHRGDLPPAWIIGLASGATEEDDAEAYLAGCHVVLHLPLRETLLTGLHRLAGQAATLPATDRSTRAYQHAAERVLTAVRAAQIPLWTADDVRVLLAHLTRYPVAAAPPAETRRVLRALGGAAAAYGCLHAIVEAWRVRFPLHAEILNLFLDGFERREIVRHVVTHQHYEDSRVYAGITTLPERIAKELCLAQGHAEGGNNT